MEDQNSVFVRLYPYEDSKGFALEAIKACSRYQPSKVVPRERQIYIQDDRDDTPPPEDEASLDELPYIELRFHDVPCAPGGLIFGTEPGPDGVVLPGLPGVDEHHFALTFANSFEDRHHRLIVRDLDSETGTCVTYDEQGGEPRRAFAWTMNGFDLPDHAKCIVVRLHRYLNFQVVVTRHDIASADYQANAERFRRGCTAPGRNDTHLADQSESHPVVDRPMVLNMGWLAQGAFGAVSRHWDVSTGEEYACKRPLGRGYDQRAWEKEINNLRTISHAHIVRLCFARTEPTPAIFLEYLKFGNLADQHQKTPFSHGECLVVLQQSLSALSYLHQRALPMAHRDIKPENILVKHRNHNGDPSYLYVKLSDFGLSKDSTLKTYCGTRAYLPPEVRRDAETYTKAVDVWSLGVVLLRFAYGLPQSGTGEGLEWCKAIVREVNRLEPGGLAGILQHMLVMEPQTRFSATACLEEVSMLLLSPQGSAASPHLKFLSLADAGIDAAIRHMTMAPPLDHIYFPPLEELLEGETVLLSWKLVASALSDASSDRLTTDAVTELLTEPFVLELLKWPGKAFEKPTAQTAAALETKTAAINVTPTPNEKYDIKAIKADALWLSRAASINEVTALRMVVTELQARSEEFLAAPLSSQDVTNIQKAAAGGVTSVLQATLDAEDLWTEFNRQDSRRRRLLATYLSERRYFAMSADYITSLIMHGATTTTTITAAVEDLRSALAQGLLGTGKEAEPDARAMVAQLPAYIEELRSCMQRAEEGIEGTVKQAEEILTEELALEWVQTALTEAVHYMSVIFMGLQSSRELFLPASLAADWFQFVGDYGFLDGLTGGDKAMSELILPLKTLACVNSLVVLNVNRAIGYLDHDVDLDGEEEPYVNSAEVLEVMHAAIVGAADSGLATASPVFLSWSLILHRMDVSYQERAERRDLTQNQRAQDSFELDKQVPSFAAQALQPRGRRSSVGSIVSIEAARYDGFLSEFVLGSASEPGEAMVPRLAMTATEQCQVYEVMSAMAGSAGVGVEAAFRGVLGAQMRVVFLEVLKASFPIVGYQSEPVSALVAVLSGGAEAWERTERRQTRRDEDEMVASAVLQDGQLLQFYVQNALGRFPYEFAPFVSISRLLSAGDGPDITDIVMEYLLQTPSLTFSLPNSFTGYAMIGEDEHATATMQTTEDMLLFPTGTSRRPGTATTMVIPAGTYGRFMIDGSGIVNMDYGHSTIALLGKWLDANVADQVGEPVLGVLEPWEAAEAIGLLVGLVRSETGKAARQTTTRQTDNTRVSAAGLAVLQEASRDLDAAKDIVTVVCDTVDTLIQDGPAETDSGRLAVLAACMDFLEAILELCPGRVWSYMARCQLLNTESRAGRLCILTSGSDVVAERFSFLMAALRFLSGLVDGAATSAVQRKMAGGSGGSGRHVPDSNIWLGASDKTLGQVCLAVAQTVVDLHENTSTWKFATEMQRSSVVAAAVGMLGRMVVYASSLAEGVDGPESRLMGSLEAGAAFVVSSFGSTAASSSLRFQPLLATLLAGLEQSTTATLYKRRREGMEERTVAVLKLATSLVGHGQGTSLGGGLQAQMFQIASLPARLCGSASGTSRLRPAALELLTELVVSAATLTATTASEPPSLLGYLGPHVSRAFLAVLARMDGPFGRAAERARIWRFFSTVLRHRQQWMANCLLTGRTPREALREGGERGEAEGPRLQLSADSVLAKAKGVLRRMGARQTQTSPKGEEKKGEETKELLAVLDFFSAAQNYWPWTIFAVRNSDGDHLDGMRAYVRQLAPAAVTARTDAEAAFGQARIAAYVAEIFAMQLYHMRQMGTEQALARDVVQDVDYYLREGVAVEGYNTSLHTNFQRNFAQRYGGLSLDQLKRSLVQPRDLGGQFYYALDLADSMLSFDGGWGGEKGRNGKNRGFRLEMEMANCNLSLVDAQIALYHAWEVLLLELSVCLLPKQKDQRLPVVMLQVAEQCLTANGSGGGGGDIFGRLAQGRANLALLLLQRLAEHGLLPADGSSLLLAVWTSISSVEAPWSMEQATYYRTLLRILYVVLRGQRREGADDGKTTNSDANDISTTQTVLTILDRVVAAGFRTLVGQVHDVEAEPRPDDMALLTAVLQACLCVPGIGQCHAQVLNIMAAHDVLRAAESLFSWSDRVGGGGDPVYGELSLLFLLELSALPVVAEQLACDGFLGHFVAAGLATHMRRPGVEPMADVPAAQRCYGIWAKAVLPLLLNVLVALGASIAPEVAYVLNQFPSLLEGSVQRFEVGEERMGQKSTARDSLTLLAVSEIHSLALLTQVLAALRVNHARDIPAVGWDAAPVRESVDFWLARPKLLRERLVPLGGRESEWRTLEPVQAGGPAENRLEEKQYTIKTTD
ncbi:nucleoporin [Grosmannia clavigera kw1407]|uniref:Nucleoporin NUP188 n=1 Tax=Grosmannia clavigera (strain kw1407 / UAMH 11150) TaxID=655863 RepID=F0XGX4_GROCL|nr:nucleoporin [Grosmannia clavigera kw1407]EFX02676.1 nucleoporin [Grosmannia clavigera kw1407]